jgi:hypothetical protein
MKRILALGALILTLAGCGTAAAQSSSSAPAPAGSSSAPADPAPQPTSCGASTRLAHPDWTPAQVDVACRTPASAPAPAAPATQAPAGTTTDVTPRASGCTTWITGPSDGDQVIHVRTTMTNPTAGEITVSGLDVTFGSGGSQTGSMSINGSDQGTSQIMQPSATVQMTFGFPAVFITGNWAATCQVGQAYGWVGGP